MVWFFFFSLSGRWVLKRSPVLHASSPTDLGGGRVHLGRYSWLGEAEVLNNFWSLFLLAASPELCQAGLCSSKNSEALCLLLHSLPSIYETIKEGNVFSGLSNLSGWMRQFQNKALNSGVVAQIFVKLLYFYLQFLRTVRQGTLNSGPGFCSRLHYLTGKCSAVVPCIKIQTYKNVASSL